MRPGNTLNNRNHLKKALSKRRPGPVAAGFGALVSLALVILQAPVNAAGAALEIVRDGRSDYCIHISRAAPPSVEQAAAELQSYLRKSTGAELPIDASDGRPDCPFISLGATAVSEALRQQTADMPYDSFRIVSQASDLFIFGPDTGRGEVTPQNGRSKGTLNGVYTFLEDYLGVRWVLPGETGEVVPEHRELEVAAVDRRQTPAFQYRQLAYVQEENSEVA